MPTILFIRHGENEFIKKGRMAGRLPGVHLNENGRKQAQMLAEKLAEAPLKAIYSSPLERAIETAAPLAEALHLDVQIREGLTETDIGEWAGLTVKSLRRRKIWRTVQVAPSRIRFPGGESFVDAQYRMTREVDAICAMRQPEDLVAIVSHADPIKLAVAYYLGLPLDHFQRLFIAPASITALHMGDASSHLLTLNFDFSFGFPKP